MIHKFNRNGVNMVLDVHSGAVHVVDELVYRLLDHYTDQPVIENDRPAPLVEGYEQEAVAEAAGEIDELIKRNLLFSSLDPDELKHASDHGVIKAICLHVAHDCNLSCAYCFASEGTFQGSRSMMKSETAAASIDFLIRSSGSRKHLEVDFFGGEPLMNLPLVKETVEYARKREKETGKKFRFTITTNGLALDDDNMEWLNDNMSNIVLSLDGRKETNDALRKTRCGGGSYDAVLPKIQKMATLRNGKPHYVRGTFTRNNLDFTDDVAHLTALGFSEISVEPVVAPPDSPYSLREEDLDRIEKEYDRLAAFYLKRRRAGKPFSFFHFKIDLTQGPCLRKRSSGCGAGTEYTAVTPEGDLYPCHQFVGNEQFRLGDVRDGITNQSVAHPFQTATIHHKESCAGCWARYYCSGGCHANAWHMNGSIHKPYDIGCRMEKSRIETALTLVARESEGFQHDQND